jgi:RimJ/RimL family protein N-acetyltransferase
VSAPRLTDGRVTLRAPSEEDVTPYAAAFRDDPQLAELNGEEENPSEDAVRERVARPWVEPPELRAFEFAIADAVTDEFLGALMLHSVNPRHRRAEIGAWVAPGARRRGVGSAAFTLALDWAFGELELERVEIMALPGNEIVAGIADRFGFTREGVLRKRNFERGRRVDLVVWGLLAGER